MCFTRNHPVVTRRRHVAFLTLPYTSKSAYLDQSCTLKSRLLRNLQCACSARGVCMSFWSQVVAVQKLSRGRPVSERFENLQVVGLVRRARPIIFAGDNLVINYF